MSSSGWKSNRTSCHSPANGPNTGHDCRPGTPRSESDERSVNQRQIEATDRQIDRLVYELYGLTEEEIATVEGAGA